MNLLLPIVLAAAPAPTPFAVAKWIAPPEPREGMPVLRKEFMLASKPKRAVLRVVGLGDYDLRVNGARVTDTGINQPWSQYEKTLYYADYDVTDRLRAGPNCIAAMLGASFWHNPNPPAGRYNKDGPQRAADRPFLLCAELTVEDGGRPVARLGTDGSWVCADGPVTFSHVFAGEDYDVRRERTGWDRPGFDASKWRTASVVAEPSSALAKRDWPGFRALNRFRPSDVKQAAPGVWVYSFSQNSSAQLRVRLEGGTSGDRVAFRCAEHRSPEGRAASAYTVGCDIVTDGKPVDHQWVHFYLGMQFVEVSGAVPFGRPNPEGKPVIRALELVHVRNGLAEAGRFRSSSDLYNKTHTLIDWAMRSNMSWVMSDCPHREKLGWLECAYLLAPSFAYRYDCREWFAKIARDMRDAQQASGRVLTVAPSYPAGRFPGGFDWTVEWGAAAVLLPWRHYEWYGDASVLRDNYECMRRFVDCVGAEARDGIAPGGLGDWYDYGHGHGPGPSRFTPVDLSSTATWAMCATAVADAAQALGRKEDASRYRALHAKIASDFARRFVDPATGRLRTGDSPQCANAMALCAGLIAKDQRAARIAEIVSDLEKRGWQQTPGDIGHVYLIRALAEAGRSDVLHKVYSRTGTGSYGGILAKGLTSLPETWDAMMDGYQSLNHCMLGHVMEWFYGYVAGIRQAPGSVGWRNVLIAPEPGALASAEASFRSPRGSIACSWRTADGRLEIVVTLPKGVQGTAVLPSGRRMPLRTGRQVVRD